MSAFSFMSHSEEATRGIGRALGSALRAGMTVLLSGDLGAGKTVLVRGIGDALGITGVRSPSFTLVNEYRADSFIIAHADLYRLDPDGVDAVGLDDYAGADDAVLLVEWPDRWLTPPAENVISVFISAPDEHSRLITFSSEGKAALDAAGAVLSSVGSGEIDGASAADRQPADDLL